MPNSTDLAKVTRVNDQHTETEILPSYAYTFLLSVDSIVMTKWQGPELKPLYEQLISDFDIQDGFQDDDLNGFVGHLKGERTPYSTIARHIKTYGFYSWRWQHKAGDYSRAVIQKTYIDVKKAYNL